MSTISRVVVDPPSHGPYLCRWPQPYESGDDASAWFVTTGGVTRQVQRDRLTDEVYTCQVLVAAGTTAFDVFTGADTSPSAGWTAPTLDQLGIKFTGHDGSEHVANFLDTTTQTTPRDGHVERTIARYMLTKITTVGSGTHSIGDGIATCHVWLHYRADSANVLEVEFSVANAAAEVETNAANIAARGGGLKVETAPTTFGFVYCDPIKPTGWTLVSVDRPLVETGTSLPVSSNAHCLPKRMGTSRRWVFAKDTGGGAAVTAATEVGQLLGLGRATYVAGQRSYHTVRAWGPTKSMLPDLATIFNGGYAQAKAYVVAQDANLRAAVASGIAGGGPTQIPTSSLSNTEFGNGCAVARMGLLHPGGGVAAPGGADGHDIEVFCGGRFHIREFARYAMLYSVLKLDGTGVFLYERTTGAHLTNKHFTDAFVGGTIGFLAGGNQGFGAPGVRPFAFETDLNSGGEYIATRQQSFAGVIPRAQSWPPHYYASQSPTTGNGDQRWWPVDPANWGSAPNSLWDFTCSYRSQLEQVPQRIGTSLVNGQPLWTVTGGSGAQWRDPEDDQHAIRTYSKLIPSIWLGCDLMSVHLLKSVSNWYAWRWCESATATTGDTNLDRFCLPTRLALQASPFPNAARISLGRGAAWCMYVSATHYAVADNTERNLGYSQGRGLRSRCEQFFDLCRLGIITQSGMTLIGGDPGGTASPYVGGGSGGTIPTSYGVFQSGLELPKVYAGFWGLLKQLESGLPASSIAHAKQLIMAGFQDYIARTNLYIFEGGGPSRGPANFVATWTSPNGPGGGPTIQGSPVTGSDPQAAILRGPPGSGSHWDDCSFICEIAYRISGDPRNFVPINSLGQQQPPQTDPLVKAGVFINGTSAYSPGLVAMIQRQPGADGGTVAPTTNPTIAATILGSPATYAATVTLQATTTNGTNPTSTGLVVTADLSSTGTVDPVREMELNEAGFWVLDFDTTETGAPGTFPIVFTVVDDQSRSAQVTVPLVIVAAATDPFISSVSFLPNPVGAGATLILKATVVPAPDSTGITVTADTVGLGGEPMDPLIDLLDDGEDPDETEDDLVFTGSFDMPEGPPVYGTVYVTFRLEDEQGRSYEAVGRIGVFQPPNPVEAPQIVAVAAVAPVVAGETLTLYGIVTPGSGSLGSLVVQADLSALGGEVLTLLDDGNPPDESAADSTFSGEYVVPVETAEGDYEIPFTVQDEGTGLEGTDTLTLQVFSPFEPTDPQIRPSASPSPARRGARVLLYALVNPGTSPDSTGLVVTMDLSAIGGPSSLPLLDDGVAPDDTEDDLVFSAQYNIGLGSPLGTHTITATVTDDQDRSDSLPFSLTILPALPPAVPDHPVPTMYDTLTHNVARIAQGSTAKIFRYVRNGANAPLLRSNVTDITIYVYDEGGNAPQVPVWSSGRLQPDAQNADGTEIVKTAVVVDGQSPSRAGHTLELMLDAADIGIRGGRTYRVEIALGLLEPLMTARINVPLASDEQYSG